MEIELGKLTGGIVETGVVGFSGRLGARGQIDSAVLTQSRQGLCGPNWDHYVHAEGPW